MKKLLLTTALTMLAMPALAKEYTVKEVSDPAGDKPYYFSPDQLTIQPGDTVTFVNAQEDMHDVMSGDRYKLGGVTETGLNLNGVNFANFNHMLANMRLVNADVNQETGQLTPNAQSAAAAEIVGLLDKGGATAATLKKAQEISQKAGIAFKQDGKTITLECGGFGTLQLNTAQVGK